MKKKKRRNTNHTLPADREPVAFLLADQKSVKRKDDLLSYDKPYFCDVDLCENAVSAKKAVKADSPEAVKAASKKAVKVPAKEPHKTEIPAVHADSHATAKVISTAAEDLSDTAERGDFTVTFRHPPKPRRVSLKRKAERHAEKHEERHAESYVGKHSEPYTGKHAEKHSGTGREKRDLTPASSHGGKTMAADFIALKRKNAFGDQSGNGPNTGSGRGAGYGRNIGFLRPPRPDSEKASIAKAFTAVAQGSMAEKSGIPQRNDF